ncbi:MAG: hypothetical protein JWO38_5744 [Gemmataceae bacterium]|nr:hypothetical protein [Gemmataceae bacterium]
MVRISGRLVAGLLLALLVGTSLVALDGPKTPPKEQEAGKLRAVPLGAIKIPLRDVQQDDDYSCGAASLMSICSYYNVGPKDLADFKRELHTDPEEGTYYLDIQKYARQLGLKAEIKTEMSTDALRGYLDRGIPVICSIQAWGETGADYTKDDNGHYVVAIGYDEGHIYFMDPVANNEGARANPRYGYLTRAEFLKRWHGDEGTKKKPELQKRVGIAIFPDPEKATPLLQAREIE